VPPVILKLSVAADDGHLFGNRLSDYDPVGLILMIGEQRKPRERPQVLFGDIFDAEPKFLDVIKNIICGFPPFYSDFFGLLQIYQFLYAF
jgi:hypothetical protein